MALKILGLDLESVQVNTPIETIIGEFDKCLKEMNYEIEPSEDGNDIERKFLQNIFFAGFEFGLSEGADALLLQIKKQVAEGVQNGKAEDYVPADDAEKKAESESDILPSN